MMTDNKINIMIMMMVTIDKIMLSDDNDDDE
jgi:hypothetical protein